MDLACTDSCKASRDIGSRPTFTNVKGGRLKGDCLGGTCFTPICPGALCPLGDCTCVNDSIEHYSDKCEEPYMVAGMHSTVNRSPN